MTKHEVSTIAEAVELFSSLPEMVFGPPYIFELHMVDAGFSLEHDRFGHRSTSWLASTLEALSNKGDFSERKFLVNGSAAKFDVDEPSKVVSLLR